MSSLAFNTFDTICVVKKLNEPDSPRVQAVLEIVGNAAEHCDLKVQTLDGLTLPGKNSLIVAIGGDGTMLEAMHLSSLCDTVCLGINLGQVGFLSDFPNDHRLFDTMVEIFSFKKYPHNVERRMALHTNFHDENRLPSEWSAFNEFAISNKLSDVHIKYRLKIDDIDAGEHKANTLIIGTPTGSTAYTLSAGGGLMLPSMRAIQIIPVAPLSLTSRPIIVPSTSKIEVTVETQGVWTLRSDGRTIRTESYDNKVKIYECKKDAKILHPEGWNYFNVLTQKLGWNTRS